MTEPVNYKRIARAIRYLSDNYHKQPSLEETAGHVNLSPLHFQKVFTEWAGISPKKFLQYITLEELKKEVMTSKNLILAAESVGLSSQSRVYDLFVKMEGVTPFEFKTGGGGIRIQYGFHHTPFGNCFIANTDKGICALNFVDGDEDQVFKEFSDRWHGAKTVENQNDTGALVRKIFYEAPADNQFKLLIRGTPFQIKVWEALLKIPFGSVVSYQHIARHVKLPGATRAVGSAIGSNHIAYLIPCHRVIRSEGIISNYRWGTDRKLAMIGWEKARMGNDPC